METDIKKETISIKGMSCKNCVRLIESKIISLKGVKSIKVGLADNNAQVEFNPNIIKLEDIKSEMQALGYSTGGDNKKDNSLLKGIMYSLIPHIGCIGFIVFSVLGVTAAASVFKPLLMNPDFFYILIAMSLLFATASAVFYLKRNDFLSFEGAKRKWNYLLTMYGTTVAVNLLLFMVVFPYAANFATGASGYATSIGDKNSVSELNIKVSIPCPGHAPLITGELNKLYGVTSVSFGFPNYFDIKYDSGKTSKQEILSLEVFKTYKATVVEETPVQSAQPESSGGCCGGSSCGCGLK